MTWILLGTYQLNVNGRVKIKTVRQKKKSERGWSSLKRIVHYKLLNYILILCCLHRAQSWQELRGEDWRRVVYGLILAALFAPGPCHREDEKHLWYQHLHVKWDSLLEDIFCVVRGRKQQLWTGLVSRRPQRPPCPPGNLCQMQERMSKVFKLSTWEGIF